MIAEYAPMGWNSWDCYGASVTEDTVKRNADYMAKYLKEYGWEYIVVDIQWYQPTADSHAYIPFADIVMDGYGRLQPAENRFPSSAGGKGFGPLADYVHSLGLKFGIHIMRGMPRMAAHRHLPIWGSSAKCDEVADPNSICMWNPDMYGLKCDKDASQDYYDSIFRMYADWGVDFVKCDDIAREYPRCKREIERISMAAKNSGRDIVLSLSPGPAPLEQAEHLKTWCNMWRITDDFWDDWRFLKGMFERAAKWCVHAGPGHWPDADMLPLGALRQCYEDDGEGSGERAHHNWTNFTQAEQRTMMTLWCVMRSPLMMGGEMTKNDEFTFSLLTNKAVLDIEKTSFCAHPLFTTDTESAWVAPRKDGKGMYAAVFNLSDEERLVNAPIETAFASATELWTGENATAFEKKLAPHDCAVWEIVY